MQPSCPLQKGCISSGLWVSCLLSGVALEFGTSGACSARDHCSGAPPPSSAIRPSPAPSFFCSFPARSVPPTGSADSWLLFLFLFLPSQFLLSVQAAVAQFLSAPLSLHIPHLLLLLLAIAPPLLPPTPWAGAQHQHQHQRLHLHLLQRAPVTL